MIEEILYSINTWNYNIDIEWQKSRYDIILLRYDQVKENDIMENRYIIRLLLLFSIIIDDMKIELIFIQEFQTITSIDDWDDMYKIRKMIKYEMIEVDIIEWNIHLISCYNKFNMKIINEENKSILNIY